METHKSSKIPTKFYYEYCYYYTGSSKDYRKHLLTNKHQGNILAPQGNNKNPNYNCDKYFSYISYNPNQLNKNK